MMFWKIAAVWLLLASLSYCLIRGSDPRWKEERFEREEKARKEKESKTPSE